VQQCPSCHKDNIKGSVHCDTCGHQLKSYEEAIQDQDKHITQSDVVYSLEIKARTKPRGDYYITPERRAKQYLNGANQEGFSSIVAHMKAEP